MRAILLTLRRSIRRTVDKGASAVEYGLMVAAIAAVIVGTVFALGGFVEKSFNTTCSALGAQSPGSCVNDPAPTP